MKNRKILKHGSYSVAATGIFVCVIILINLVVHALPSKYTRFDVSSSRLYSIGDETKKVLHNLDRDVTIYQIAQEGNEDENLKILLQRYEDETSHIKAVLKDPVVNPKFVSGYTSGNISSNSLIIECGERSKVIDYQDIYLQEIDYDTYSYRITGFDGEGQITSAIDYVTSDDLPVMYILHGHGEKELDPDYQKDMEKLNIEIRSLSLLTEPSVPEDCSLLMILSPGSDFSSSERDEILSYLKDGGRALITTDYTDADMSNLDEILKYYGIQKEEGIVFEGSTEHYALQTPYYLLPEIKSTEASLETYGSGYYILLPYAQGIKEDGSPRDTCTSEKILVSSDAAYSKTNLTNSVYSKEQTDIDGPFALGIAVKETIHEEAGETDSGDMDSSQSDEDTENYENETKIVYFTSSSIMDSNINAAVSGGNEKLILECVHWMTRNDDQKMNVSIPAKSLSVSYLTITERTADIWKIAVIGIVPFFFLILGFTVWMKRRKA